MVVPPDDMAPTLQKLTLQARMMRFLMRIGLRIHKVWSPMPPRPSFTRWIPTTLASPGSIRLSFYTPAAYTASHRRRSSFPSSSSAFPCVISFHGGGFTLGSSTDDERFFRTILKNFPEGVVIISVAYRLAPEHPFPTAVDDGADAVLWVAEHAAELGIDPSRLALCGFSSGANLALSVPVRLADLTGGVEREVWESSGPSQESLSTAAADDPGPRPRGASLSLVPSAPPILSTGKNTTLARIKSIDVPSRVASSTTLPLDGSCSSSTTVLPPTQPNPYPPFTIRALCPFYPSANYTLTRAQRRATNPNPATDLGPFLTKLFDNSYFALPWRRPRRVRLDNPYLSPGKLSTADMRRVYAGMRIVGVGCEHDMLCAEGAAFMAKVRRARRFGSDENDDDGEDAQGVTWAVVRGAPHAWDKRPFLTRKARVEIEREYEFVCRRLGEVFAQAVA